MKRITSKNQRDRLIPPYIYNGHWAEVHGLTWSPTSPHIVSADMSGEAHVWETTTGRLLHRCVTLNAGITAAAWSPDGTVIALADQEGLVTICDANNGKLLMTHSEHDTAITSISWSPDGTMLASCDSSTVYVWRARQGETLWKTPTAIYEPWSVAWSPDGNSIALSNGTDVCLLDTHTWSIHSTYGEHSQILSALAWSPDSRFLASASDDLNIDISDANTGNTICTITTHEIGMVVSLSWSPDGNLLAATSDAQTVAIYDVHTTETLSEYIGHTNMVNVVAWSPDGQFLATAGDDRTVHIIHKDHLLSSS